jgi:hypothetical protein
MVAKRIPDFQKRNCKVFALSCDGVESHKGWQKVRPLWRTCVFCLLVCFVVSFVCFFFITKLQFDNWATNNMKLQCDSWATKNGNNYQLTLSNVEQRIRNLHFGFWAKKEKKLQCDSWATSNKKLQFDTWATKNKKWQLSNKE